MSYSTNDTSEDLHPKPSLVDSTTIDKAMNESVNNTTTTFHDGVTDKDTNMEWNKLANYAKMVCTSDRQDFAREGKDSSDTSSSTSASTSLYSKHSKKSATSNHRTSDAINNAKPPNK